MNASPTGCFHERGVRVFRAAPVRAQCSCSRTNVENMLGSFTQEDRDDMVENGKITVTCEFCSSTYVFEPDEIASQNCGAVIKRGLNGQPLTSWHRRLYLAHSFRSGAPRTATFRD